MLGIQKHDLSQWYGREVRDGQAWKDGFVVTHMRIVDIKKRIDISDYYVFAFVRDPYTRIVSEYNWRMRNRAAFEEPTGKLMSFESYCELLHRDWDRIMDNPNVTERQHVTPQHVYVDEDVDLYRFENFAEECEKIKKRLGITGETPRVNWGGYATKHTERTKEITRILYGEDFKTFNYSHDHITSA